jgi:hypothetical protein
VSIFDDGNFRIEAVWKELVEYWEGERGYVFDAAWGVKPGDLYVPASEDRDAATPEWMNGRRDEIAAQSLSLTTVSSSLHQAAASCSPGD